MKNKRFQFRMWLEGRNEMREIDGCRDNLVYLLDPDGFDHDVMQASGVSDIENVDIYEGDLIKCDYEGDTNTYHYEVRFIDSAFVLWQDSKEHPAGGFYEPLTSKDVDSFRYKVVGNIHQNKELLT